LVQFRNRRGIGRSTTRSSRLVLALVLAVSGSGVLSAKPPETRDEFEQYKKDQSEASNKAYQAGDYPRVRAIEAEVLELSRRFGDRKEEAMSIYALGLVGTATGELDAAESRFRESLPIWKAIDDQKGTALSMRGLGRVLEAKGRLPEATEVQVAALELLLKFGQPIDQSESYYSLGRLFLNLEDYPAALHAIDRAIELMGPKPPDFPLGLNLAARAEILRESGRHAEGLRSAQGAFDAFARTGSPVGEAIGQLVLGKALARNGEAAKGLQLLRAGEATAIGLKEDVLATDLQFAQGWLLVGQQRHKEALAPLQRALATAERLQLDQTLRNISLEQEKAYSALGRTGDALAASKRAFAAQSRLATLAKVGQLAGRSAESQLAAVSSRFLSLDEATRSGAPVLEKNTALPSEAATSTWLYWLGGLTVFALVAAAYRLSTLRRERTRLHREQADLVDAHSRLQDHSAQLAQQVSIDPLTGTLTRRAFTGELNAMLEYARVHDAPVTLAVFDLDHFKQINDRHGHLTGDAALRLLVGLVREQLDSEDLFGRFGGDEFLLASRNALPAMQSLAERIRASVEQRSRAAEPGQPALSISLGLAQAGVESGYDSEELFQRADTALYQAKAAGRNRIVAAGHEVAAHAPARARLLPANE
jgi:diguanylate cyclase (GGDEF)-like protein